MKNRTTTKTTGPIKNKRTTKNTTLGSGVSETSRPTISGGRVIKVNSMNRDNNTMTSNKVRLDRNGNVISNQVTDYNKIPFKNKAIDLIDRIDYNIANAMNRGVEQIKSAPSVMRQDLREIANKTGRMLTKENYNKGEVTSEFDGNVVSGVSRTRPTISGGIQEKVKYDMPGGGKRIEKKRYNEEGYITDKKIKDRKINPR